MLDLYTRESLALVADRSLTGREGGGGADAACRSVAAAPQAITVDNGGEFVSRAMDAWAYAHDVRLDFIRPGKPVENAFIESFNGQAARRMPEPAVLARANHFWRVAGSWCTQQSVEPSSALLGH